MEAIQTGQSMEGSTNRNVQTPVHKKKENWVSVVCHKNYPVVANNYPLPPVSEKKTIRFFPSQVAAGFSLLKVKVPFMLEAFV